MNSSTLANELISTFGNASIGTAVMQPNSLDDYLVRISRKYFVVLLQTSHLLNNSYFETDCTNLETDCTHLKTD